MWHVTMVTTRAARAQAVREGPLFQDLLVGIFYFENVVRRKFQCIFKVVRFFQLAQSSTSLVVFSGKYDETAISSMNSVERDPKS